jgi:hypothetical protein
VLQRVELSGFQRGDQVILSWKMPARNAPKASLLHIQRADIYRLAEPVTAKLELSEQEFSDRAILIAALQIRDEDFGLKEIIHRDNIEFTGQSVRLRYAVRLVNASGQRAAFSNAFVIEPAAKVAAEPQQLWAEAGQDAITLRWTAPEKNIDGSPASIIGYNVYRSSSMNETARLLNPTPINATIFADENFDFDKDYLYFVRAVSAGLTAGLIESRESEILRFRAIDTFPPSPPGALTIAASPGVISIFFAANPELDVVGYHVYRTTDPMMPKKDWERLTDKLLSGNVFRDERVESGKTYYYYLTAADKSGNVSQPSEVVSDLAL